MLNIRSFSGADRDSDHCLMVAEVRERLTVSKQTAHNVMWQDLIQEAK
jgi:hypothetical protein